MLYRFALFYYDMWYAAQ